MGGIFALGSNGSGQLGIGHKEDVSVPKPATGPADLLESRIVKVAAGGNHTLILTASGGLYWSGDASSGACGRVQRLEGSSQRTEPAFRRVDLGDGDLRVGLIAATWEASIFTGKDAEGRNTKVWSMGTGMKGELGQGELIVKTPVAGVVCEFPPPGLEIISLSACMGHVAALLSNGEAFGWGNGRKGQLGLPEGIVHAPRKIEGIPFKVARVVCGREFTCLVGQPETGDVVVLGSDKWDIKSAAPKSIPGWKEVQASWSNIFVLNQNDVVTGWGRDDHGQKAPPGMSLIAQISAGSEHSIALTQDGNAIAWGWGEHGNCGPHTDNGDVKGRWNVIASSDYLPPDTKIVGVAAGCATSWVILAEVTP
jgi:protein ATS1